MNFLIDHSLEIIAILVAFIIYFLQRQKKALSYDVVTNSSVVSVSDKVKDNIQVLYRGEVVSNVRLLEIRITNTGTLAIKPDDYIEPLTIQFPNAIKYLSSEIIDNHSLGVNIVTELSDASKIVLDKTLLNPKDSFVVKALLGEGNTDFSITGRIVGLSKIQTSSKRKPLIKPSVITRIAFIGIVMTVLLAASNKFTILEAIGFVGLALSIVMLLIILTDLLARLEARLVSGAKGTF